MRGNGTQSLLELASEKAWKMPGVLPLSGGTPYEFASAGAVVRWLQRRQREEYSIDQSVAAMGYGIMSKFVPFLLEGVGR